MKKSTPEDPLGYKHRGGSKEVTGVTPQGIPKKFPRGSTYTTIRELGPIILSIVWYFGA